MNFGSEYAVLGLIMLGDFKLKRHFGAFLDDFSSTYMYYSMSGIEVVNVNKKPIWDQRPNFLSNSLFRFGYSRCIFEWAEFWNSTHCEMCKPKVKISLTKKFCMKPSKAKRVPVGKAKFLQVYFSNKLSFCTDSLMLGLKLYLTKSSSL